MSTVMPPEAGAAKFPERSEFSSEAQEIARKFLKQQPEAEGPQSAVIQERLQEPSLADVAAGIPGISAHALSREEAEVKGQAILSGARAARESVKHEVEGGSLGIRTIKKGDGRTSEKMKKLFPKE